LGFSQPIIDVEFNKLHAYGWGLVRRPTGGRAILHTDELTYALIGSQDEPRLSGGVLESYHRLSYALLEALNNLNVSAQVHEFPPQQSVVNLDNPICFENPSNFEITVAGKKIIGSAQARCHKGVLQHGSLPLSGDLSRITRVLHFPDEVIRNKTATRVLEKATTLESVLGFPVDWVNSAQAFIKGFQTILDVDLFEMGLSRKEGIRATELFWMKYHDFN
jgi:lipoate-protein ligase A